MPFQWLGVGVSHVPAVLNILGEVVIVIFVVVFFFTLYLG